VIAPFQSVASESGNFRSCFISHASSDAAFVKRLHADLEASGVGCWYAPRDLKGGRTLAGQIDAAISSHERLLLVLSEASMLSNWVKTELLRARVLEADRGSRIVFPISLVPFSTLQSWTHIDADTGLDIWRAVRSFFVPDFSDWTNHSSYELAFRRLLSDLRVE